MLLTIAWHNLRAKPVQSLITVLVIAASVAMMLIITLLSAGIHTGLTKATEPFDLIVGAKGSPNQLVLNTVFLQDAPIGNISLEIQEELSANPLVAEAIPLGFGDSYQGYPIVGADAAIFRHRPAANQPEWLQLETGRAFTAPFEAVLGAKAARELGLQPSSSFRSMHGRIAGGHTHEQAYRVVGILHSVSGPYDQAIWTSLESIWLSHEKPETATTGIQNEKPAHAGEKAHKDTLEEENHAHDHDREVTAILVKPKGYGEAMRLYQQFQKEANAQMVFPAQIIIQLFTLLGQGEQMLKMLAYIMAAISFAVMALAVYWSTQSRIREQAILRALGASVHDIATIILMESALLSCLGLITGTLAGHTLYALLARTMESKTAVVFLTNFSPVEIPLLFTGLALSLLAGFLPALLTCRTEVARLL